MKMQTIGTICTLLYRFVRWKLTDLSSTNDNQAGGFMKKFLILFLITVGASSFAGEISPHRKEKTSFTTDLHTFYFPPPVIGVEIRVDLVGEPASEPLRISGMKVMCGADLEFRIANFAEIRACNFGGISLSEKKTDVLIHILTYDGSKGTCDVKETVSRPLPKNCRPSK